MDVSNRYSDVVLNASIIKIIKSRLYFSVFNLIFLFSIFRTTRVRVRSD